MLGMATQCLFSHMGPILQLLVIKEESSAKQGFSIRKDISLHSPSTVREEFPCAYLVATCGSECVIKVSEHQIWVK